MKLNYKLWRQDYDNATTAEEKTLLLSIRAHIKGKVHRKRARLDWKTLHRLEKKTTALAWLLSHQGGTEIVDLDYKDQMKCLGDKWMNYVKSTELPLVVPEPKTLLQSFREKLRQIF